MLKPDVPVAGGVERGGARQAPRRVRRLVDGLRLRRAARLVDQGARRQPRSRHRDRARQAGRSAGARRRRLALSRTLRTLGIGTSTRNPTHRRRVEPLTDSASSTTLTVSYELDLWGRNRAGVRAAESSLRRRAFDRDTARLTLIAGVATGYFDVLSLRTRLAIARENLAIARAVLDLVSARARNGAASALDVSRQEATVLSQRAALLPLEQQERQTLAALADTDGPSAEGLRRARQRDVADLPVPADRSGAARRSSWCAVPTWRAPKRSLSAANADVAAARAALLPSISLTGSAGVASSALPRCPRRRRRRRGDRWRYRCCSRSSTAAACAAR